ncbi:MAG: DUF4422 domain-containing protein, partial [Eubacterium sp.]|nr:DUF4422 domain-containing protein [Eubacterium sp.]
RVKALYLLKNTRILVPKRRNYYIETLYSHYAHTLDGTHLDLAREILEKQCPDDLNAFDQVMKEKSGWMFNMFLMERKLFCSYCSWLFPILEELERRVDTSAMTGFEKRYIGRVSELLLNVWLVRGLQTGNLKNEDIREIPHMQPGGENWGKKISSFVQAKFFGKKYKESF